MILLCENHLSLDTLLNDVHYIHYDTLLNDVHYCHYDTLLNDVHYCNYDTLLNDVHYCHYDALLNDVHYCHYDTLLNDTALWKPFHLSLGTLLNNTVLWKRFHLSLGTLLNNTVLWKPFHLKCFLLWLTEKRREKERQKDLRDQVSKQLERRHKLHVVSRSPIYPNSFICRYPVPDEKVHWEVSVCNHNGFCRVSTPSTSRHGTVHPIFYFIKGPKEGRGCLMSSSCLKSQGCHLVPLLHFLCCFSAQSFCSLVHLPDFFPWKFSNFFQQEAFSPIFFFG